MIMNLSGIIGGISVGEQETKFVSQEPHASGFEAVRVFSKYPKLAFYSSFQMQELVSASQTSFLQFP